jgi:transcriptional regulator GlxA family with amidase domain
MKQILPTKTPRLTVNVLLFEAFSNMILACLLEPLRVVRDEARAEVVWRIFTQDDRQIRSSSGLTITADQPLAQAEPCDLLLIIGGDRFRTDAVDPTLLHSLRLTRTADMVIAAILRHGISRQLAI